MNVPSAGTLFAPTTRNAGQPAPGKECVWGGGAGGGGQIHNNTISLIFDGRRRCTVPRPAQPISQMKIDPHNCNGGFNVTYFTQPSDSQREIIIRMARSPHPSHCSYPSHRPDTLAAWRGGSGGRPGAAGRRYLQRPNTRISRWTKRGR